MLEQSGLAAQNHNPDVLSCIANLSSDEVFTPPELANQILDKLELSWAGANDGANIWADKSVTFLDPFTKSGVFLREITRRLGEGLVEVFPDLEERIDHILTKQVYGIGLTELTSLLTRRSLYCSKYANGPHSVARSFKTEEGNIWFERTEHTWTGGKKEFRAETSTGREVEIMVDRKCRYCSAGEKEYTRWEDLETHAYAFIHTDDVNGLISDFFGEDMHFDVVIGNPPYQLSDGGFAASARPIYHLFFEKAVALDPKHIVMVTPSRWFSGGKGLDKFRLRMLEDKRIQEIVDFTLDRDAFPSVNINGGVNFFLWSREYAGDCRVTTVAPGGHRGTPQVRALNEFDIFIRRNEAVTILRKVRSKGEQTFDQRVSSRSPFGLRTFFHGVDKKTSKKNIKFFGSGKVSWVGKEELIVNDDWAQQWKVLIPAASDGNEIYPLPIWDQVGPFVSGPGEACSETYLVATLAKNEKEAECVVAYMRTKFFRFMVSLRKIAQHNKAQNFSFVPDIPMNRYWTDQDLYRRYGLDDEDIRYIDSTIREMNFTNE